MKTTTVEFVEPKEPDIEFWEDFQYGLSPGDCTVMIRGTKKYREKIRKQLKFVFGSKLTIEESE